MKKRPPASAPGCATGLVALASLGLFSLPVAAETLYSATAAALPLDHLLREAAWQQQMHAPLTRIARHPAAGRESVADPSALYLETDHTEGKFAGIADEAGATLHHRFWLAGAEYQVSPRWLVGGHAGQMTPRLELTESADKAEYRNDVIGLYAQWGKNGFTSTALAGYQHGTLETERTLADGSSSHSEADTHQQVFSLAGRYAFKDGAWRYGPFSRLDLSRGDIDAHTESGDDATFRWEKRISERRLFSMGVHGTYLVEGRSGSVAPYVILATRKEFHPKRDSVAGLEADGGLQTSQTASAHPVDARWYEATAGVRFTHGEHLMIASEWSQSWDLADQDRQSLSLRVDWLFSGH